VTLIINNETQKEQFMSVRQNFVDTLRLELQNSDLAFEVLISKQDIQPRAYKPMDVFKAMAEKNPALLELKKRFDLEIDY
jgi:DNA polymerase-3 subunit gamma/tau